MSDEELTQQLRARFQMHEPLTQAGGEAKTANEARPLLPASEQNLGRVMERIEILERRLDATYKVAWRTSAAVVGLTAANYGWDWLAKLLRSY